MGLDPIWIATLRDKGYSLSICSTLPDAEVIGNQPFLFTSDDVAVDQLPQIKEKYPDADLIYLYQQRGVAGWASVATVCAQLKIRFVRPGIGTDGLVELFDHWYRTSVGRTNLIGVFSALPGTGATNLAAAISQTVAKQNQSVIMAGLNLYNPGMVAEASVSLDAWRQRLISRMLQAEDFDLLLQKDGFRYLPGNQDILGTLDYTEEEIEHLLNVAQDTADVVVGDFGAIPESAAWLCGLQRASIRIMVAHPSQESRVKTILQLSKDLGIANEHWLLVLNKAQAEDVSLRTFASACGMQPLATISYQSRPWSFGAALGRRDQEQIEEATRSILAAIKGDVVPSKKRGWF